MQTLLATEVREVDKSRVYEGDTVLFNDSQEIGRSRTEGMQAGDFYFRPNLLTEVPEISNRVERFLRRLFRRPPQERTKIADTIVISCPMCALPILGSLAHKIVSRSPLTIDKPIACPYSPFGKAHAFRIEGGKVMPA